jgi:hypothetical protein
MLLIDRRGLRGSPDSDLPLDRDLAESITDSLQVVCSELDGCSTDVLMQALKLRGTRNRDDPGFLRQKPRNRNLRLRWATT